LSTGRRILTIAVASGAAVLLGVGLFRPAGKSGAAAGTGSQPGQTAPLFESTDLTGRPVRLAGYRGRPVLLNFWASWCVPCRSEFPILKRLQAEHPDLVLLGVVFQDGDASARAFMQSQGATWPGVRDPKSQIADAYGVRPKPGIPVSMLIGSSGRVIANRPGPLTSDTAAQEFVKPAVTPSGS
jgi:cytochrome c biogenesis protein CcmG, thiol:disulfide interchange protein DsbE